MAMSFFNQTQANMALPVVLRRKDWDDLDLELAGAINVGPITYTDPLTNPLHPLVAKERWGNLSAENFELLRPSLRLATHLIAAGMDHIYHFVESKVTHDELAKRKAARRENVIEMVVTPAADELTTARAKLIQISRNLLWHVNDSLGAAGALGMTRHIQTGIFAQEPWENLNRIWIDDSDYWAKQAGHTNRPLLVGIIAEYLVALKNYPRDSEEYLRAMFHCAVTVTHEIGHVIWCQDWRDVNYADMGTEPYVKNQATAELGLAFESHLFSGYHVRAAKISPHQPLNFTAAAVWNPFLTTNVTSTPNRPLYRTQYAIPISYMQKLFKQNFWDQIGAQDTITFPAAARARLDPNNALNYDAAERASANIRNWTIPRHLSKPRWEREFTDRGINRPIETLISAAELEVVKDELRPFYKATSFNPLENPFGEPDDEEFDILLDPTDRIYEDSELTFASDQDVSDGSLRSIVSPAQVRSRNPDVVSVHNKDLTKLTRVVVRFSPPDTVQQICSRRRRATIAPEDEDDFSKQPQIGDADNPPTIEEYLNARTPRHFAKWTHEQAWKFCEKNGLRQSRLASLPHLMKARLHLYNKEDRPVIERLRNYAFTAADQLFAGDRIAKVRIAQARVQSQPYWSLDDARDLLSLRGLQPPADPEALITRALKVLEDELQVAKDELVPDEDGPAPEPLPLGFEFDTWKISDWEKFAKAHYLPASKKHPYNALRATRLRDQIKTGYPPNRRYVRQGLRRMDADGNEWYVFDVALHLNTLHDLKAELFDIAELPADHDIKLYFDDDRAHPLQNPLADEEFPGNILRTSLVGIAAEMDPLWERIQMVLTEIPLPPKVNVRTIAEYVPVMTAPPWNGAKKRVAGEPDQIDPAIKRRYDIRRGIVEKTFTERMREIERQGFDLERVLQIGGGVDDLRPELKRVLPGSVAEMLDTLEDIEEINKAADDRLTEMVDGFGKKADPVQSGRDEDNLEDDLPEHMVEVFKRTRRNQVRFT